VSEFASLQSGAMSVVFSSRHAYLAGAAVVCALLAVQALRQLHQQTTSLPDLKRVLRLEFDALPLRGWPLYAVTGTLQFGIGMVSAIAEGSPFLRHDAFVGLLGALLAAVCLAFATRAIVRRLPSFARAMESYFERPATVPLARRRSIDAEFTLYTRFFWFTCLFNRPPPTFQS